MLTDKELNNIKAGGVQWYIIAGGIITFLIGLIDGYLRPSKCN